MILKLLATVRPHWRAYLLICTFGLTIAALEMVPPRLVGRGVDLLSQDQFQWPDVFKIAAAWGSIVLIIQLLHGAQIHYAGRSGERILANLRIRLFSHLQRLSMGNLAKIQAGRILTTLGSDLEALRNLLSWGLNTLFANSALMLLAGLMIFWTDTFLFLATVWLFPTMVLLNFIYGKRITEAWSNVRLHSSLVGATQAENIAGIREVTAFNRQERNLRYYNYLQEINTANNIQAAMKSGLFQPVLQWTRFLGIAILLGVGGYRVLNARLAPGDLVAAVLYWDWFMLPAINFGNFLNDILVALASAQRVWNLLETRPEVQDHPYAKQIHLEHGACEFDNVSFGYQPHRLILKNMSFKVKAGTMVALVGESGSGKSTILSLLARFYDPLSGRVLIDGQDLRSVTLHSLHTKTAFVSQVNYLFSGTVMENIKIGRPRVSDEEVYAVALRLGCHEKFLSLPKGYSTTVGEKGIGLSLGERQLVCFARALLADPRILLLDEPMASLDARTSLIVHQALRELVKNRTTFVVTHRLSTAVNADIIFVLKDGKIVEQGQHFKLMERHSEYYRLYQNSLLIQRA